MCENMDRNIENRLYEAFLRSNGVSTDSRSMEKGAMFVALKGENFDGNRFAQSALDKGAGCVVVSCGSGMRDGDRVIVVEDTLEALQAVARRHRSSFRIPVIALTGTNGKTTTKELVSAVLSMWGRLISKGSALLKESGVQRASCMTTCRGQVILLLSMWTILCCARWRQKGLTCALSAMG